MRSPLLTTCLLGTLALGLTACSTGTSPGGGPAAETTADETGTPGEGHGDVAGAEELAEPRLGLTTIDPSGSVAHLDLLDEGVVELGSVGAPTAVETDGRYLFAETPRGLEVVDSGVWTWDHVDHFHYYRADPRLLGTLEGDGAATVATTNLSTSGSTGVHFAGSGDAVLLDTEALSRGEIHERFRLAGAPGAGMVVPVGSYALVTEGSGATTTLVGYTADGDETGLRQACPEAAGTIATRVGAVVGCSDGALLATVDDDELVVERIPYPEGVALSTGGTAPPATAFDNREGRPTVAALAGSAGIWLLDTRARAWTLLPAPAPLVSVTAVDDADQRLLALAQDGRVLVLDGASGQVLAETAPLVADSLTAGRTPTLIADQQRAYLSAPTEGLLYEIDPADGARIARSFETATEPAFVAETGR
ncbi:ABC transporter [Frigoribacterium sp. VKM Ac-2836]|uniref:ABC transporter n=1 Tax=Frigoribacterium sp. VKM Ac-2836 TaxID=2739014 RepID=UPI0015638809|nr:ABC transporter [Frigoribacterium sp. VKM Ac-2836]NRD25017.1 ABC transporter [Frigoribacterium sp. VKM Ac-2836]